MYPHVHKHSLHTMKQHHGQEAVLLRMKGLTT